MASRDPTARLSRPDPTRHGEKTLGADRHPLGTPQKCLEAAWEGNVWVQAMGETLQSRASWDTGSYPIRGSSVGAMGLWGHHPSWHPLPCFPATWHSPGCLINPKHISVHPQAPLLPAPSPSPAWGDREASPDAPRTPTRSPQHLATSLFLLGSCLSARGSEARPNSRPHTGEQRGGSGPRQPNRSSLSSAAC